MSSATNVVAPKAVPRSPGFLTSSVGKKVVMAVTGVVLFGFVVVHMLGNLQVYLGPEALNALRRLPARAAARRRPLDRPRRAARRGGAARLGGHRAHAGELARRGPSATAAWLARGVDYASRTMVGADRSSRLFIVYHLLAPDHRRRRTPRFVEGDVYRNVVRRLPVAAGGALLHRRDAGCSACTSTTASGACSRRSALAHPRYNRLRHGFATVFAVRRRGRQHLVPARRPGRRRSRLGRRG